MALSKRKQAKLRRLENVRRKWGYLGDNAQTEYEMLKREQGVVSGNMKQGKTKFIASARIDRDMGHALSSALKPEGVEIRLTDKSRGQTDIDAFGGSSVYLSSKSRWEDAQVATRRAGNAPALPVIKALLPPAMLNVWLGIEGAQSAIKQADWTHNRKIVTEQQRWLSKKDASKDSSISLQDLAQRSALGVPFPASEFTVGVHDSFGSRLDRKYFDWFDQNSDQLEQAVAQSESLEDLAEVALWVGEELGLIEPEEQQEPDEPDNGQKGTDTKPPDNQDDSDGGDGDDSDDDDADNQDSPPDDSDLDDSDKSDETDSDSSSDEGKDNQDKPESSEPESGEPEEDNRTLKEKLKDSIAEAMLQEDNSEPKQNELFDLQAKPEEKVIKIPASETATTGIVLDYWAKAVADDFQMPTQEVDDYFGEPQADLLHEIRMGILDVFDEDREEAPQLIIAVDVSISMNCMCKPLLYRHNDNYYSAGWLAWQVAGLLGQQFPTAEIFAWSTTTSRDSGYPKPFAAPVPVGKRPLCNKHEGSFSRKTGTKLLGNTPESEAMLHAQTLLASNENSVLVLVTDGEPQNKARAHGVSHAMYQAGTRFSVVTVGSYQTSLEEMHYPPATVVSIKTAKDLSKVSKTFAMMQE
jgi:hypothetical protein